MNFVALRHVSKSFLLRGAGGTFKAVSDVSLAIPQGRTFGLVGESGSGKSTIAQMIVGLVPADDGTIEVGGRSPGGRRRERGSYLEQLSIVFQSPFASLDPKMTVSRIVGEPLRAFRRLGEKEITERVGELLQVVGLSREHLHRYPHEFSGGQRQRIAIARAISINPKFLVLDEPTSALDVSVQARIVNLLAGLKKSEGLTYLFISHNIGVVRHISDLVGVMYRGRMLEIGDSEQVIGAPAHPYTKYLIAAVPRLGAIQPSPEARSVAENIEIEGGCPFAPRCTKRLPQCAAVFPSPTAVGSGQTVYCHLYG